MTAYMCPINGQSTTVLFIVVGSQRNSMYSHKNLAYSYKLEDFKCAFMVPCFFNPIRLLGHFEASNTKVWKGNG